MSSIAQNPFTFAKEQITNLFSYGAATSKTPNSAEEIAKSILQNIKTNQALTNISLLKKDISSLSSQDLKRVLDTVMKETVKCAQPIKITQQLAEIIPLEQLENATKLSYPEHIDALQTAKEMLIEARHFLNISSDKISPSIRNRLSAVTDGMISLIETILATFGIADLFAPAENMFEADRKQYKITNLLTFSSMIVSVIGATVLGSSVIGYSLLTIAGASLVYPYVSPAPSYIPKGINWTKQCKQQQLSSSPGRKKSLDEIANTLIASTKVKTHPLLIGPSGVGKTETVKAFVQAIERGDYPELVGKQVFYFNTADLVKSAELLQSENKILSKINQAIGRHRNNIILVFDEIHLACQKDQSVFGEQLKTLLDPGQDKFPYVIGITTQEEYFRDIHVNNAAFARRFKRINIENSDNDETQAILANTALQQAPNLILENGVLQTLQQKTKEAFGTPEPISSLKILSRCIQKTNESQKSEIEKKVETIQGQIRSLHEQNAAAQGSSCLPYQNRNRIQALENTLVELEQTLQKEQAELREFFQLRDSVAEAKKTMFQTVVKVSNLQKKTLSVSNQKDLASFILLSHFLAPAQEKAVRSEARRLNINTVLDPKLIDEVIREEREN